MATRPKLIALNVGLGVGLFLLAWQAGVRWDAAQAERRANLNVPVKRITPPPMTPIQKPETVQAAKYADVAAKNLFSKDRNPTVIVDAPKVEPPKVMPPLPVVYGVLGLPSGIKAIMAERSGAQSRSVHTGEDVGEFKILALDLRKVTFEWEWQATGAEPRRLSRPFRCRSQFRSRCRGERPGGSCGTRDRRQRRSHIRRSGSGVGDAGCAFAHLQSGRQFTDRHRRGRLQKDRSRDSLWHHGLHLGSEQVVTKRDEMKNALTILLLMAFGLAAQAPAGTGAKTAAAKKTSTVKAVTIPADAIATPNGSYSWTDKQGKRWLFVKTPFGIMKSEAIPTTTDSTPMTGVKAFDDGDKVRFETATPFGVVKREKNKTDLTDEERSLYDSQNPGQSPKQD